MTVGGVDSAKAKTGDVVNHVFSDRGVVGSRRLNVARPILPDRVEKWGGGIEQALSLKYSRVCAALQAGAICVGIGINLGILRRFWV
jgi:hypothetical protein